MRDKIVFPARKRGELKNPYSHHSTLRRRTKIYYWNQSRASSARKQQLQQWRRTATRAPTPTGTLTRRQAGTTAAEEAAITTRTRTEVTTIPMTTEASTMIQEKVTLSTLALPETWPKVTSEISVSLSRSAITVVKFKVNLLTRKQESRLLLSLSFLIPEYRICLKNRMNGLTCQL